MTGDKTPGASANLRALSDLCTPWCIHVVATLRIADHIATGKTSITTLAAEVGCDPDSLLRVLRHLVGKGVFQEPTPGRIELNEEARELLDPSLQLGLDLGGIGGRMAYAWGSLLSAVRTGAPAYHEMFGLPFWEDLEAHPDIAPARSCRLPAWVNESGSSGRASSTRCQPGRISISSSPFSATGPTVKQK